MGEVVRRLRRQPWGALPASRSKSATEVVSVIRMLPVQLEMALAALGWGTRELARAAGVSLETIGRFKRKDAVRNPTIQTMRAALEAAGVEFTNGDAPGVRLRKG